MGLFAKRTSRKAGLSPGTLIHIGDRKVEKTKITLMNYDEAHLEERELPSISEPLPLKDQTTVTWINVDGLHEVDVIAKLGGLLNIHPLTQEDVLNTGQRPKAEGYDEYIYVVFKMLYYNNGTDEIRSEQVSLVLGSSFLISFQEATGDVFDIVRERIRKSKGRIRKVGADYLAYALMDAVVDHYFVILEKIGERLEIIEQEVVEGPGPQTLAKLHDLKREMIYFRRQIWPTREILNTLVKEESAFITDSTKIFFRDVYDHTIQVIDTLESFRDLASGMLDVYLSTISNRMNEIMKVLTIIATIFIPMTFIAGIYGMNFKYMPELEWHWAYPMLWLILIGLFVGMLAWFRHKKWL
jgi:magnesium transporter